MKEFSYHFDSRVLPYNMDKYVIFNTKSSQKNLSLTRKRILKNEDQISKIIQTNNKNKIKPKKD